MALAVIAAAVMPISVHLGPDASWDLRNYHIYNPFALLHKAPGIDLYPAQMQSFLPPALDIVPYWLRLRFNGHPDLLCAAFALPSVIAALLAWWIALLLIPPGSAYRRLLAGLAVLLGVTGAAGLPAIGTTMSEMPAGCFVLGALLLLAGLPQPRWQVLAAGALLGIGVGLKLTVAPFAIAAGAAYLLAMRGGLLPRAAAAVSLGAGAAAGAALSGGPWWLHLYAATGNPIFPYYNDIFRSPLFPPIGMTDGRFAPHGLWQTALYPFFWGFQKTRLVTELVMRDPRIALAGIALAAYAATGLVRRRLDSRASLFAALFMAAGYILWEAEFSIFRYLAPLELLSGVAILLALRPLLDRPRTAWIPPAAMAAICLAVLPFTRYPHWDRAIPNGQAASVAPANLPRSGMVLLLTADPMAYIAAFTDPSVRFVGVNNNLVRPGDQSALAQQLEHAVRSVRGPLWGLEIADPSGKTEAVLRYYGLERGAGCSMVQSNLEGPQVRLCPLQRVQ